jgi:hypothetical protein
LILSTIAKERRKKVKQTKKQKKTVRRKGMEKLSTKGGKGVY